MIDFEGVKQNIKILDLVGGMKKVASTGGGEWSSACPFCGGSDRFRVQPAQNIWLCRNCTDGVWRDVVDFIARRDNVTLVEAARQLGGQALPSFTGGCKAGKPKQTPASFTAGYRPPGQQWQASAAEAVEICKVNLYSDQGAKALDYLHRRGLTNDTIKRFELGYSQGAEIAGLWVPHGITIPAKINGVIWYVKIRTNKRSPKYTLVKGSKPAALYNGDDLIGKQVGLIVEGEFNCMVATQEAQDIDDVCGIASMGAAGNRPDLASWGPYFIALGLILALYDNDEAGESGAFTLHQTLGDRVKLAAIPEGVGDLNDWYSAGGDVFGWLAGEINFHKDSMT